NDQADGGRFRVASGRVGFEEHSVNVALEVVHGDERFAERQGQHFAVGDADEERADQAWALRDGDRVEVGERDLRLFECFAYYRHDLAEVLAGGEFWDHAAVLAVDADLRGDDI